MIHRRFVRLASALGATVAFLVGNAADVRAASPIKHVVIFVMENRTLDNMFNGFPGADTVPFGRTHDGRTVPLVPSSMLIPCDADHSHSGWIVQYDGGKMDGFDATGKPCPLASRPTLYSYGFVPQQETIPYRSLARQYGFADRMFASQTGPSYPGHLYLVAGQSNFEIGDPGGATNRSWGCDATPGTNVSTLNADRSYGPNVFPCFDATTLGDLADAKGIAWRWYTNEYDYNTLGFSTSLNYTPYDSIFHIRYGPDWSRNIATLYSLYADAATGHLPPLAWINPPAIASDHANSGTNLGPEFVASVVNLIMTGPNADDTAIFITWDDPGGWYDHVAPPQLDRMGLGFRVPLVVVSKYAKRGYVSHVQHEYGSILKFAEEQLGLPSLGATDVRADDLGDMFDFTSDGGAAYSPLARRRTAPMRAPYRRVPQRFDAGFFLRSSPDRVPLDDDQYGNL